MTHLCEVLAFAALAYQVSMSTETTRCPVYDARSARSPLVDLNEEDRAFKKAFVSTAPATENASTKFVSGVGVGVCVPHKSPLRQHGASRNTAYVLAAGVRDQPRSSWLYLALKTKKVRSSLFIVHRGEVFGIAAATTHDKLVPDC